MDVPIPALLVANSFRILPCLLRKLIKLNSRALLKLTVQITLSNVVIEKREVSLSSKHKNIFCQYTLFSIQE